MGLIDSYDAPHRHPLNRLLHGIGIPIIAASAALIVSPWRPYGWPRSVMLAVFAGGWALLFIGHAIEGNRPAVFTTPSAVWAALVWWAARIVGLRAKRH